MSGEMRQQCFENKESNERMKEIRDKQVDTHMILFLQKNNGAWWMNLADHFDMRKEKDEIHFKATVTGTWLEGIVGEILQRWIKKHEKADTKVDRLYDGLVYIGEELLAEKLIQFIKDTEKQSLC